MHRVEAGGGFIEKKQRGFVDERTRDGVPLDGALVEELEGLGKAVGLGSLIA